MQSVEMENDFGIYSSEGVRVHELPAPVRRFVQALGTTKLLHPQEKEQWMRVIHFGSWHAAHRAACLAALDEANTAGWCAARRAMLVAACDSGRLFVYLAAHNAAANAAREAGWDAEAAEDAAAYAASMILNDLVDITSIYRWWRAWELGSIPLREEGDKLVVAAIRRAARRTRQNGDDR